MSADIRGGREVATIPSDVIWGLRGLEGLLK